MTGRTIPLTTTVFMMLLSALSISDTRYVDANSPNDPGSGSYENPFRRIQDAIDYAANGDVIEIQPGIYMGSGNYDLNPAGKSITIRGIHESDAVNDTIIDPAGLGRGFYFGSGEDPNCVLSGVTIRNGYAEEDSGGGIAIYHSRPTIVRCIIENNFADLYGGGVYCYDASSEFAQCIIRNNMAGYDGGGMEFSGGAPKLKNCIIVNNQAAGFGGGCDIYYDCRPIITHCVFVKNSSVSGGGICCTDSRSVIESSIFWENQAYHGPQAALELSIIPVFVEICYSDIQGGRVGISDPNNNLVWGSGNINTDPFFVSFDANSNPQTWDFHLQSGYGRWDSIGQTWVMDTNTSPCIDRGNPDASWSGELWPNGKRVNMGAYGATSRASKNGNPADFNVDNMVNLSDFQIFTEQWLDTCSCHQDFNLDGEVNTSDLMMFIENWLWNRPDPADFNGDNIVNLTDFARFAGTWLDNQGGREDLNMDGQINTEDFLLFNEHWLWRKR